MKDLYGVFNIPYHVSLLDIVKAYLNKCTSSPSAIFYYTKILKILTYTPYKVIYDSLLFQVDIRILSYFPNTITEEEEYELAMIIFYIENLKDYVYDSKFIFNDDKYLQQLENWYNELENILEYLKQHIQSFYLS